MKPTFNRTVNILVQAYLNDTLAHKLCTACAVGNIIAAVKHTHPAPIGSSSTTEFNCWEYANGEMANWYDVICANPRPESHDYISGLAQIESTGYTVDEIREIEYAFENAPGDPSADGLMFRGRCVDPDWMFNGLMAVVDVLADIHNVDLSVREDAKLLFAKP